MLSIQIFGAEKKLKSQFYCHIVQPLPHGKHFTMMMAQTILEKVVRKAQQRMQAKRNSQKNVCLRAENTLNCLNF